MIQLQHPSSAAIHHARAVLAARRERKRTTRLTILLAIATLIYAASAIGAIQ